MTARMCSVGGGTLSAAQATSGTDGIVTVRFIAKQARPGQYRGLPVLGGCQFTHDTNRCALTATM